jgi:hypothetical protein
MENQQLIPMDQGGELCLSRPPETILREAEMVAGPWHRKVEALGLFKQIGDSKHLYIEAWQMLGAMFRVTVRIRETRYVEMGEVKGYEATAEAYHIPTGQVVSTADAMCLSDEDKWGPRTKYEYVEGKRTPVGFVATPLQQLRSMAQTRACSKVLSNLFKWIARMRGYQGTPAEEMTGHEYDGDAKPAQPQRKSAAAPVPTNGGTQAAGDGTLISEKQAARIWALGFKANRSKDDIIAMLHHFGFATVQEVTREKYEALCTEIQRTDAAE